MHTWSENPKNDMMQHLELLTYEKNCKKLLNGEIDSKREKIKKATALELKKITSEIAFCIKQGIEFFENADSADISISPLLIYYGILSFSKALIIANSSTFISLDNIRYHGLTSKIINNTQKKNKKNWRLLNECVNTNDGVFLELCKVLGVNMNNRCKFELKETLKCIPEIKNILEKTKVLDSKVIFCYEELKENNDKVSFQIYSEEEELVKKNSKKIEKNFIKSYSTSGSFLKYESKNKMSIKQFNGLYQYDSVLGGRYFIFPTNYTYNGKKDNILLNQILLDYINLFILSEQVRYHQDNWNKILNGENESLISILKIYIEIVKRRFPNMILNELFNERFSYGSPAYLN